MKFLVLYASKTGNTKKLAQTVFEELPGDSKELKSIDEFNDDEDPDLVFLGFWTDRGSCSMDVADVLDHFDGKKIAYFGTCGMGDSPEYYESIKKNVDVWTPENATNCGCFVCQGKMPTAVLERYDDLQGKVEEEKLNRMIQNYHNALTHPDEKDVSDLKIYVKEVLTNNPI